MRNPTTSELWDAHKSDLNQLAYWYPKIKDLGIPTPKTIILPFTRKEGLNWIEEQRPLPASFTVAFQKAAREIGYPVFIRTDMSSGKFDWNDTCYVASENKLIGNLSMLLEANEEADLFGLNYSNIIVREYLHPNYKFTAYKGMPVTQEYRFFAEDGQYECHHPYWFEKVMLERMPSHQPPLPRNWRTLLKETYPGLTGKDFETLKRYVSQVGLGLGGYWSVDFIRAQRNDLVIDDWFLTDMALGLASYHYPGCEYEIKKELKYT